MTAEERKRQLALLSQLDGTASLDAAEPPGGALSTEQVDLVPTSARQPLATTTAQRGDVLGDHSAMPEQPPADYELQDARGADVDAYNDRATEMALRQIVGGITRTGVPGAVSQLGTAEKDLMGLRRQSQLDALRNLEAENNGARTAAYNKQLEAGAERDKASGARADAKLALDMEEAARRDARTRAEQVLKAGDLERKKAADALKAKKPGPAAPGTNRKDATELRKEFNQLPDVKTFGEVDAAYQKVKGAAATPSAAGDLSAIFAYMKMLDPGSSVREGEFANAQNAGGIDTKIASAYNNVLNGQRLSPEQRVDFINQAQKLYATHKSRYDAQAQRYRELATKANAAPDDVTGPMAAAQTAQGPAAAGGFVTLVDENGEELDVDASKVDAFLKKHPKMRRK